MALNLKLKELAGQIRNSYGEGSCQLLGEDVVRSQTKERMPSGIRSLDVALNGGWVRGAMHELYGNEGEGKTTIALHTIAEAQRRGHCVAFIDAEHSLNKEYAQKLGVDTDNLLVAQPDYGEQGVEVACELCNSGIIDLLVIDSVTALVPKAEIDGDMTDACMGAHARLMSKMCRVITPSISRNGVVLILINQVRMKIGVFFGSPETTTGGKGIKFYSGMRIRIGSSQVKNGGTVDESKRLVKAVFKKHKWGKMYAESEMLLNLGEGIDLGQDALWYGLHRGIITLSGSFYKMDNIKLGNGRQKAGQTLLEHIDEYERLLHEQNDQTSKSTGN